MEANKKGNIKKTLLVFGIIILSIRSVSCQKYLSDVARNVVLLTFIDRTKTNSISSGTGTLLVKAIDSTHARVYLVTNLHVLPQKLQNQYVEVRVNSSNSNIDSVTVVPIGIYDRNWNFLKNVKPDKEKEDLVVIDVTYAFVDMKLDQLNIPFLSYQYLADKKTVDSSNIYIGDEVYFIGYPSWFFDRRNAAPILRRGVISTEIRKDFYFNDILRANYLNKFKDPLTEKLNGFLIDANAVGGSSGSLVFVKQKNISENGIWFGTTPPLILGILKWSFLDLDNRTPVGERINLGAVVSADRIKKLVEEFTY